MAAAGGGLLTALDAQFAVLHVEGEVAEGHETGIVQLGPGTVPNRAIVVRLDLQRTIMLTSYDNGYQL